MVKISQKKQKIILILIQKGSLGSSGIHNELKKSGEELSLVTVKRDLSEMASLGLLVVEGAGRSITYRLSTLGRVLADIDARAYCAEEPDRRYGSGSYNFELFSDFPNIIFSKDELKKLENATKIYKSRTINVSPVIQKKELERLIIELSWKSSKIEGNTYTLLDTEKLILENREAPGHDKKEAQMILNHKDAFMFIRDNAGDFLALTRNNLEQLHAILVKDLNVSTGLRTSWAGVQGSKYQPLDNVYQIKDALDALSGAVSRMGSPYEKACLALSGISYIQLFDDGNKRTGRFAANALLMAHGLAPLSYRSVEEKDYREAMLVFYELNSIVPIKKIFLGQYEFAAENYAAK